MGSAKLSEKIRKVKISQQDGQADHMNSSVLQVLPHLCVESGNPLGHGQGPGNGNTAWLQALCQFYLPHILVPAHGNLLSVVRGCGQPLDSCPMMQLGRCLGSRRETQQVPVFYQVVCLP